MADSASASIIAPTIACVIEVVEKVRSAGNTLPHVMPGYLVRHEHPEAAPKDPDAY
ncbi:hypothetical protein [Paraburkholderia sp. UCT31]|uniref:hypothetical protein n=1 Tax=Paraburkholderia sp. UCT31 TaxID=2615209 RepID=UPI00165594F9|nr:hypothetical protein [Paraburkholderia sp. UCT31]